MNDPMFCMMVNEYVDDELRPDERIAFEQHLIQCDTCQDELEKLLALQYKIVSLPKTILPQRDLWPLIESALQPELQPLPLNLEKRKNGKADHAYIPGRTYSASWYVRAAAAVLVVLTAGAAWLLLNSSQSDQNVSRNNPASKPAAESSSRTDIASIPARPEVPDQQTAKSSAESVGRRAALQKNAFSRSVAYKPESEKEMEELTERLKRGLQLPTTALLPSSAGKVAGSVTDEQGKPVRGMTVEVANLHRSTLTDDNGKFEFFGLAPDAYTLQVYGIGYQKNTISGVKIIPGFTTQVNFLLRSGSAALTDVAMNKKQLFAEVTTSASLDELPLASYARPSTQSNRLKVEGKVTDERGRSIVGAVVLVLGTKRGGYSDNEGKFHIYGVPPGTYTLQATAQGFLSRDTTSVQVFSDFPVELNIALDPAEGR